MKNAVKYNIQSPIYVFVKKHVCPKCGSKTEVHTVRKVINSRSPEAKDYDFSAGDTYYSGDVEFRVKCFYCPNCRTDISIKEMRNYEKSI